MERLCVALNSGASHAGLSRVVISLPEFLHFLLMMTPSGRERV